MAALIQSILSPLNLTPSQRQVVSAAQAVGRAHAEWLASKSDGAFTKHALSALARAGRVHYSRMNGSLPAIRSLCSTVQTVSLDGALCSACLDAALAKAQAKLAAILAAYDAAKALMDAERAAMAQAAAVIASESAATV